MPYASGRTYLDADSHIMELPNFMRDYAEPDVRDLLEPINGGNQGKTSASWDKVVAATAQDPGDVATMVELGDQLIAGPKGYEALGAFNPQERVQALDQLGFERQLVFATFSPGQALLAGNPDIAYGAARAHNRAMSEFCGVDERLMGVGMLPLDDPDRAVAEADHLIELGLSAAWVAHRDCGGRSPGHDDLDPVWARLAEAGVPFVLHVGGFPLQLEQSWMTTGRPIPNDWQGGGENIRGKDMLALHHNAELFIGAMIFDGVFHRHENLRGAAVELGAGWVPSWLRRLDWSAKIWKKEPDLGALPELPSETVRQRLAFTPFVYEDVGQLIAESNDELYLFSSDYPHFEGSRNPIERFEGFLADANADEGAKTMFYEGNFRRIFSQHGG